MGLNAGCGGGSETSELSGKITFRGQALNHGMISLFPSAGRPLGATIQPDGTYQVTLPPDSYGVIVLAPPKLPEGFKEGDPPPPSDPNALPVKYGRKETSGLSVTIEPGSGAQQADFDMQ
jgi:hypothetical protein